MEIKKIVLTGGPCAGKTMAMERIKKEIPKLGYRVLFIPETATELISGGVCPWTCGTNYEYQTIQMHMQREKENAFRKAADTMGAQADRILIVCDRGMFDNMVYMTKKEFYSILEGIMGEPAEEALAQYDRVFHLVTAAIGTDAFATLENNAARYEDAEVAQWMDEKFTQAWSAHPSHYKISSDMDFEKKMKILLNGISDFLLGKPLYEDFPLPEKLPKLPRNEDAWEKDVVYPD